MLSQFRVRLCPEFIFLPLHILSHPDQVINPVYSLVSLKHIIEFLAIIVHTFDRVRDQKINIHLVLPFSVKLNLEPVNFFTFYYNL